MWKDRLWKDRLWKDRQWIDIFHICIDELHKRELKMFGKL